MKLFEMGHPGVRGVLLACALLLAESAMAQSNRIFVDATVQAPEPGPAGFALGTAVSPSGHVLGLNARYLTLDKKPWLPVMGEFHFSRVPEAEWETEILKMKAAGVQIVATYIFWIHHEEIEGKWDWTGQRDLHKFVALCGKHGMYVYVRVGPWAHGEARNGGFPDWLLTKGPTRRNDPTYMGYVKEFFGQIAGQLKGELWKDGGPVVGVQIENEYHGGGPGGGAEYILALKKLVIDAGLDTPFYSVTAWDRAVVPHGSALPVYGGYPDAPWDASLNPLPASEVYQFRFGSRVAGNMGVIGGSGDGKETAPAAWDTPFITAEMGGGIEDTYHRRPALQPDDVAAMMPVMLGSGVNLYGTYMFHGGVNPDGKLTTLEESQKTKYPSDLPVKSYDFQAPLGPYGQERPLLKKLKVVDYFLNDFGAELAPMTVHPPTEMPKNPGDLPVARVAVRSAGDRGFVFVNNHVRGSGMPPRNGFQMTIKLPGGELKVPSEPVDVPADAYFIWPFGMDLGGVKLRYSTAQLFTKLNVQGVPEYVFFCVPGVRCEFSFDRPRGLSVEASRFQVSSTEGQVLVAGAVAAPITLRLGGKVVARIAVLTAEQAEDAWKVAFADGDHLLITPASFFADDKQVTLESDGASHFAFDVMPALAHAPQASRPVHAGGETPLAAGYEAEVPATAIKLQVTQTVKAGNVGPAALGPTPARRKEGLALSPEEDGMNAAARWTLTVSPEAHAADLSDILLKVRYVGDIGQLKQDGRVLDDNFYNGQSWTIGLKRFNALTGTTQFELNVLPLNAKSAIFLEPSVRKALGGSEQVMRVDGVTAVPVYRLTIQTGR